MCVVCGDEGGGKGGWWFVVEWIVVLRGILKLFLFDLI